MNRLKNSLELIKASTAVLKADKELVVFPLISGLLVLVLTAIAAFGLFSSGLVDFERSNSVNVSYLIYGYLYYFIIYTVIIFSNSALVGAAMIRLNGGNPTLKDGIDIAMKNFTSILGYAFVSATVGILLRIISDKAGIFGKIFAFISSLAWNVITYLVVPVLVVEEIGPIDAIKKSASLFKKTWGEQIIGNIGMGLFFGLITLAIFISCIIIVLILGITNLIVLLVVGSLFLLSVLAVMIISSTLESIYIAAVYRFASEGKISPHFSEKLLKDTFIRKDSPQKWM